MGCIRQPLPHSEFQLAFCKIAFLSRTAVRKSEQLKCGDLLTGNPEMQMEPNMIFLNSYLKLPLRWRLTNTVLTPAAAIALNSVEGCFFSCLM